MATWIKLSALIFEIPGDIIDPGVMPIVGTNRMKASSQRTGQPCLATLDDKTWL
jgi:hypothetical protein